MCQAASVNTVGAIQATKEAEELVVPAQSDDTLITIKSIVSRK